MPTEVCIYFEKPKPALATVWTVSTPQTPALIIGSKGYSQYPWLNENAEEFIYSSGNQQMAHEKGSILLGHGISPTGLYNIGKLISMLSSAGLDCSDWTNKLDKFYGRPLILSEVDILIRNIAFYNGYGRVYVTQDNCSLEIRYSWK